MKQGIIFMETMRRNWRQMVYWGMGLLLYAVSIFLILPDETGLEGYGEVLEGFDEAVLSALGIAGDFDIGTPEGYIGYSFFGFVLLIMSVYAVIAGLNITAVDEDSGTMDVVLSLPVTRWQVIVEKIAAYTVIVFGIGLISFVGMMIGQQLAGDRVSFDTGTVLAACLGFAPPTILMIAITAFVGTVARRRTTATAIAGGFVVASYLINAVGSVLNNDLGDAIKQVSVFNHYAGTDVFGGGVQLSSVLLVVVVTLVLVVGAVQFFEQRDIAV